MQLHQPLNPGTIASLETLVVQQLEDMLREERQLAERYQQLGTTDPAEATVFSDRLSRFGERANRLYRLMQAMEDCWPMEDCDKAELAIA